jgi:hypothetical protein
MYFATITSAFIFVTPSIPLSLAIHKSQEEYKVTLTMVDTTNRSSSKMMVSWGGRVAFLAMVVIASLCAWNAGTSSFDPEIETMAMPLSKRRQLVEIVAVGSNPTSPLGLCEGDCDRNSDVSTTFERRCYKIGILCSF